MLRKIFSKLFFCVLIGGLMISCVANKNISLFADSLQVSVEDVSVNDLDNNNKNEQVENISVNDLSNNDKKEQSEIISSEHLTKYSVLMPLEHLLYLEKLCNERNLDFELAIAVIKTESDFNHSIISNKDYGYFQINLVNHEELSKKLNTSIEPLNPYVNINWGTYMLSDILSRWEKIDGLSSSEVERCALSEYNKGYTGFMKHGEATGYISRIQKSKEFIRNL